MLVLAQSHPQSALIFAPPAAAPPATSNPIFACDLRSAHYSSNHDDHEEKGICVRLRTGIYGLLFLPWAISADPLHLCHDAAVDPKYEPSVTIGKYRVTGLHNVMTLQALTGLKIDFQLHSMPWFRCLHAVSKGAMDGAIGVGWTKERAATMHFPLRADGQPDPAQALFAVNYSVYRLKTGQLLWDGQQFKQVKYGLAAPKGFVVAEMLQQLGVLNPIDADMTEAIKLTLNRRLDGFVQSQLVAQGQLTANNADTLIEQLEPVFFRQPLYLTFSRQAMNRNPEQLSQIWQSLVTIEPQLPLAPALPGAETNLPAFENFGYEPF